MTSRSTDVRAENISRFILAAHTSRKRISYVQLLALLFLSIQAYSYLMYSYFEATKMQYTLVTQSINMVYMFQLYVSLYRALI